MITEKIGNTTIERHDDINELVVKNYNLLNEYALYDAEVGNDLQAVAGHFQKMDYYIAHSKKDELIQVRTHMHQTFYHIFQKNNFPALQWAVLLHSIEGQLVKDYSLDNLKKIIDTLSTRGLTQGKVLQDVELAKKKSKHN